MILLNKLCITYLIFKIKGGAHGNYSKDRN